MRWSIRLMIALIVPVLLLSGCRKPSASTQPVAPAPQQPLAPPGPGGVVQGVRQAPKRLVDSNQLREFALLYIQHKDVHQTAPTGLDDLAKDLDPKAREAFREGFYMAVWNVRNPTSGTILAYVKEPDHQGLHMVVKGDRSVERMNSRDLEAALKGQ